MQFPRMRRSKLHACMLRVIMDRAGSTLRHSRAHTSRAGSHAALSHSRSSAPKSMIYESILCDAPGDWELQQR